MDRIKIKYLIDLGMVIAFITMFITGLTKFPGLLQSFGINRSNLPMGDISKLHDWTGITMLALVSMHLLLNWKWILSMTKKYIGSKK